LQDFTGVPGWLDLCYAQAVQKAAKTRHDQPLTPVDL